MFKQIFGEAYMKGFDAHLDRQLAEHTDAQDRADALAQALDEAVDEMVNELFNGREVRYGTTTLSTGQRVPLTIDASDVRDEIDGEALRGMVFEQMYAASVQALWIDAARRVCERHVDEYLEWRTTV